MKQYENLKKAIYVLVFGVCFLCVILAIVIVIKKNDGKESETEITTTETQQNIQQKVDPTPEETEPTEEIPVTEPPTEPEGFSLQMLCDGIWDASVQSSNLYEFYPDGTGRILCLLGVLGEDISTRSFEYTVQGNVVMIQEEYGTSEWYYSEEENCLAEDVIEYGGNPYHHKIMRMSHYEMYLLWSEQIETEINQQSQNWMSQADMTRGAGSHHKARTRLMEDVLTYLERVLPQELMQQIQDRQAQWEQEKLAEMEEAASAYEGGSMAPMVYGSAGADCTERRTYELLLMLPDGFDRASHTKKIESIRERFYATEELRENLVVKYLTTHAEAYYLNGELKLVYEYPNYLQGEDPTEFSYNYYDNCQKHWYYDNGEVYFIYMLNEENGDEYRLYFDNGELIRWIDPDGEIYDVGYCWSTMQGYYEHALSQCEAVKDRG